MLRFERRRSQGAFCTIGFLAAVLSFAGQAGAATVETQWVVPFDGMGTSSSPVVERDTVFVAGKDGAVHAFEAATGRLRWRFETGEGIPRSPRIQVLEPGQDPFVAAKEASDEVERRGLRQIVASPVIEGGIVFVGSRDHSFYAVDAATGDLRWSFSTGGQIRSDAIVDEGAVYFFSDDGFVHAADAESGAARWSFETLAGIPRNERPVQSTRPVLTDGALFFTADARRRSSLHKLDAETGESIWTVSVAGGHGSKLLLVDGYAFFLVADSERKVSSLFRVDAETGQSLWSFGVDHTWSSTEGPLASDGYVLFATDHEVFAVDQETGAGRWSFPTGGPYPTNFQIHEQTVYVERGKSRRSSAEVLHALRTSDGTERWQRAYRSGVYPRLVQDGVVYLQSHGTLIAVDAESGAQRWRFKAPSNLSGDPLVVGSMVLVSSQPEWILGRRPKRGALYCLEVRGP